MSDPSSSPSPPDLLILFYHRDPNWETYSGSVRAHPAGKPDESVVKEIFTGDTFEGVLARAARFLEGQPQARMQLRRDDAPAAAPLTVSGFDVEAMQREFRVGPRCYHSDREGPLRQAAPTAPSDEAPSVALCEVPPVPAGLATIAEAFGEEVYVRLREEEIECPGCGFWTLYTTRGLRLHPERAGAHWVTAFRCTKRCRARFVVTCYSDAWASVRVRDLLAQAPVGSFYLPRGWNQPGGPWIAKDALAALYAAYLAEKESVEC